MYCLAAILPLLPAKQRQLQKHDWMNTDHLIACPDPNCGGLFKITREKRRDFFHHQVTKQELSKPTSNYFNEKIIRGCWQLSLGHSQYAANEEAILNACELGFNTFDCADIYTGVESLLGQVRQKLSAQGKNIKVHTKFVPDLNTLAQINFLKVEEIVDRSLKRLKASSIDLLQFHWWDFSIAGFLDCLDYLNELKKIGKIKRIGLTNFDTSHLEQALERGVPIYSLQSQVSLFDRRSDRLRTVCKKYGIKLFGYGGLLGGFLSNKWLGVKEPDLLRLGNRSLVKYKLIIDDCGGWSLFQKRLARLNEIAMKHSMQISQVAISALIQAGLADAVIVGLSPCNFAKQNKQLAQLKPLSESELNELASWSCQLRGDAYALERQINSKHGKIMRYNLNVDS